jgi:hypothetical protein
MAGTWETKTRPARWAFFLFIAGLLLPFCAYAVLVGGLLNWPDKMAAKFAVFLCAACELLAIVTGVIGWRHILGKTATVGSGMIIGLMAFASVMWLAR